MCRNFITGNLAQQQVAHHRASLVSASLGQRGTHGAEDAHHAGTTPKSVKGGDVAVADNPLPGSLHFVEWELVYELDSAIAAAITEDGLDAWVTQSPVDITHALFYRSSYLTVQHLTNIGTDDGFKAP